MTVKCRLLTSLALLLVIGLPGIGLETQATRTNSGKAQITVLYDAFGKSSDMQKDWGYSALIEYGGRRILFDTGNNPDVLARNAK